MKLVSALSHMPFKAGDDLFFCKSEGHQTFVSPQSPTAAALGVAPQTTVFQPWSMAVLRDGVISDIDVRGMRALSPSELFCNPVVTGNVLSFIYGRALWTVSLSGGSPKRVQTNVFTGFYTGDATVTAVPSCSNQPLGIRVKTKTTEEFITTDFVSILRVIPQNEGYLITGNKDGQHRTIYWKSPTEAYYVMVGDEHVYKSCLDGDYVIHAKKEGGFEDRFLYRELFTLVPHAF